MYSCENLELAFKKACKGKTFMHYVVEFEKNLQNNLLALRAELLFNSYAPKHLTTFIIKDPKTRRIDKSDFRDRIVHHALCNVIEPLFDKTFIYDSYANRIGKGTLKAIQRFDQFKRIVSKNNTCPCYVLKADIKHYFENVDHKKLLEIIKRKISDSQLLVLIKKVILNYHNSHAGKGMPLGNLTSQFFANVYLNELDQFIKHRLKAKYYLRYVDDFVLLHKSSKQLLIWKINISKFLQKELFIELHPQKSSIRPLAKGIDLLGFTCFYYHRILRKRNLLKMLRRIESFKEKYRQGFIESYEILASFQGWNAYAIHANTYKIRRFITKKVFAIFSKTQLV